MKMRGARPVWAFGILFAVVIACGGTSNPSAFDDKDASQPSKDSGSTDKDADIGFQLDATFNNDGGAIDATQGDAYADATPDVQSSDGACVSGDAGAPPLKQRCAPAVLNECDHAGTNTDATLTSFGVAAALLNGTTGNGFDDDCDGLVDEGCSCNAAGTTKDCFLVPATQIDATTKKPVGWCTENAKGSLDCSGTEFPKWSGTCRGAQPPYAHDVCAAGDFNCDGLAQNSDVQDCSCHEAPVTCPTTPITEKPYPDPKAIKAIDGNSWIGGGAASQATNWKWTVLGGDCDNILPHPTFAIFNKTDSTAAGARIGARTPIQFNGTLTPPEYVSTAGSPLVSMQAATGNGTAAGTVYPAFALSGDYVVQGEFDLSGQHYVCTQKVEVRAEGIRAELCWDTVGRSGSLSAGGANDIDLHLARLQGISCPSGNGWDTTCSAGSITSTTYQDCWYSGASGCRDFSATGPGWGYADSPDAACIGWGSKRHAKQGGLFSAYPQGCTNPRLDRDNISCDPTVDDPNNVPTSQIDSGGFCGPENINLDNPKNGDQFVVGVTHFGNTAGSANAKLHVNLYCQGARVISVGYNPASTPPSQWPLVKKAGADSTGDFWTVATLKWNNAAAQFCDVATIPSKTPDPARDGPANKQVCVESADTTAPKPYKNHKFNETTGGIPATPADWCKH